MKSLPYIQDARCLNVEPETKLAVAVVVADKKDTVFWYSFMLEAESTPRS